MKHPSSYIVFRFRYFGLSISDEKYLYLFKVIPCLRLKKCFMLMVAIKNVLENLGVEIIKGKPFEYEKLFQT